MSRMFQGPSEGEYSKENLRTYLREMRHGDLIPNTHWRYSHGFMRTFFQFDHHCVYKNDETGEYAYYICMDHEPWDGVHEPNMGYHNTWESMLESVPNKFIEAAKVLEKSPIWDPVLRRRPFV